MKKNVSITKQSQRRNVGLLTSILVMALAFTIQPLFASGGSRANPGSSKPNPYAAAFLSAGKGGHFAWMNNQYMVRGDVKDHFSRTNPGSNRPGVSRPFYYPEFGNRQIPVSQLLDISTTDTDVHYAWYLDGDGRLWRSEIVFSRSKVTLSSWSRLTLPTDCRPDDLLFIVSGFARHFAVFSKDGVMRITKSGRSGFKENASTRVRIAPNVPHRDLVYMAAYKKDFYGFNRDGRYFKGWENDLDAKDTGYYDYHQLRRLPQPNRPKPTN